MPGGPSAMDIEKTAAHMAQSINEAASSAIAEAKATIAREAKAAAEKVPSRDTGPETKPDTHFRCTDFLMSRRILPGRPLCCAAVIWQNRSNRSIQCAVTDGGWSRSSS